MKPTSTTVIVPTYNAARFIADCVGTLKRQTLSPSEVIFVDDASRDDTVIQLKSLTADLDFPSHILALERNGGPSRARNVGMEAAKGDWVAFLDADDLWEPHHLADLRETATATGASFVYSTLRVVNLETGEVLDQGDLKEQPKLPHDLYLRSFIMPSQVAFDRQLLQRGCRFDERLRHGEDADFWIALYHAGASFACTGKASFVYRKHGQTPSQNAEKCASATAYRMAKYDRYRDFAPAQLSRWARQHRVIAARLAWRRDPLRAFGHLLCAGTGIHRFL
ncbi:MAG: glycosyltransferase family 2 protein [Opitutales bacterium]